MSKTCNQAPPVGLPADTLLQTPPPTTWNLLPRALAGRANSGLVSPVLGSPLIWTQEGSEIGVVGRKGGQGGGSPSAPASAFPSPPAPWLQLLQGSAHGGQAASDSWGRDQERAA